jgi:perosamine synthetase
MTQSTVLPDAEVRTYEAELVEHLGVEHVVAVSSGTAALHCALAAIGVKPGDEVLLPALGVVMSAAPVHHLGATPVFVDCTPDGSDFDYHDLTAKITDRTRAILPVYLWGRAGDENTLRAVADEHGLALVVDACQALGTTTSDSAPDGTTTPARTYQAGARADVACFSTQHLKLLSTGEGGFLTTNDAYVADQARAYRSHWQTAARDQAPLTRLAYNFRLAAPLAAIGRRELSRFDDVLRHRIGLTTLLLQLLRDVPPLTPLQEIPGQRWNHYAPLLRLHLDRPRAFAEHLATADVPNSTGTFQLIPLDQRPMFTTAAPGCAAAAEFLDGILAVVLTPDDDEQRVRDYAETIALEASTWASR